MHRQNSEGIPISPSQGKATGRYTRISVLDPPYAVFHLVFPPHMTLLFVASRLMSGNITKVDGLESKNTQMARLRNVE